ncbi:MAG: (Fe-S)-binding protein [Proteobacteria bacterium]|nr:(Fe-S)-binding protein [Pseudomonadota bacterium]
MTNPDPNKPFRFSRSFRTDHCNFCGICFERCPVLAWPESKAKQAIHDLIDGNSSEVLSRCTGCMACNNLCPEDANPHTLIVERWGERYRKEGLPARAKLVLPYQRPNLFTLTMSRLPQDEKRLVETWEQNWKQPPNADTMFFAGCNTLLQPFLMQSRIFENETIFGSLDLCCAEPLYRIGLWDALHLVAKHLQKEFARMGFKRLVMPCLAGYHLFKHVYHELFDIAFDCEIITITDWFLEAIADGRITPKPLGKRVVIHDNCWPKASGEVLFDQARELLERLGLQVVEPAHTREQALCCGMCAVASNYSLTDAVRVAKKRVDELEQAPADMAMDYCGGCNWIFPLVGNLSFKKPKKPMYHLIELVQMATGEEPVHRTGKRSVDILTSIAGPLAAGYLSPKRFWIEDILGKPVPRKP